MAKAIPNFTDERYGLVSGAVFNTPFAVGLLLAGIITQYFQRKRIIGFAQALWSGASISMAYSATFMSVCVSRGILGAL